MKKIFLSIIFLLVSTQLVFSKEVRTRFGFYINLPNYFAQLDANIDELLKKDKEGIINKEFFDDLKSSIISAVTQSTEDQATDNSNAGNAFGGRNEAKRRKTGPNRD